MNKLCCATFLLCIAASGFAQEPASHQPTSAPAAPALKLPQQTESEIEKGLIHLDVTVTDASGKPVSGLDRADFKLLDKDAPARILTFHAVGAATPEPDAAPTEMILVIDEVNLLDVDWRQAEKAVDKFLRRNGGRLAIPVSVYRLSVYGMRATSQPSTDGNAVADEMAKIRGLRWAWQPPEPICKDCISTPKERIDPDLHSQAALGSIALKARRKPGRKLVVWISFGWTLEPQLNPFYTITEFSTRLREARISLYRVNEWFDPKVNAEPPYDYHDFLDGVTSEVDASSAKLTLEVLATQSGGAVHGAMKYLPAAIGNVAQGYMDQAVAGMIDSIVAENSAFYSLSFDPPRTEHVDEYHDLKVLIGKPGLAVHTNTGYYDQPVYYNQPRSAAKHLTVEQLEQMLDAGRRGSKAQLAKDLSTVELTEQMSTAKLISWQNRLPDKKIGQALVAVADASAFLELPAAEIPAAPKPTLAEQSDQFSRIARYVADRSHMLPTLFATRITQRYEEPRQGENETWKTARADRSLSPAESTAVTILYRNGSDVEEPGAGIEKKAKKNTRSLETHGTFGPILSTVVADAAHGKLVWGGWEKGQSGPLSVFRYSVPENISHYDISHCCYPEHLGGAVFHRTAGYHGMIVFDPNTGAILRLTVQTDLNEKLPLIRSDIAVEYSPVEIGGNTYTCPVKSVSITRGRTVRPIREWDEIFETYGPFETLLTDVSFRDYHRLSSTSRILPGFEEVPDKKN